MYKRQYADSPLDGEQVGEEVYISMANKAEKYCWFITPYLIITDEMTHALTLAAKRGVDAVSYTHLDVYKRQSFQRSDPINKVLTKHKVQFKICFNTKISKKFNLKVQNFSQSIPR